MLLRKAYFLLAILFLYACSKTELIYPEEPGKVTEDLNPESFQVTIAEITSASALIKWTEALDPEYEDIVYSVQLDGKDVANHLKTRNFRLEGLKAETTYKGLIVAKDPKGNTTSIKFEFTTDDDYIKFTRTYYVENPGSMSGNSIHLTADGGYIVAGNVALLRWNILLIKFNKNGDREWYKTYDFGPGGTKLLPLPDGYIISSASTIYRLDSKGTIVWKTVIDLSSERGSGELSGITLTKDNHIVAVGKYVEDFPIPIKPETKLHLASVVKLSLDGAIIWHRQFGEKVRNEANDVLEDASGNLYIYGSHETGPQLAEMYLSKITRDGTLMWSKTYTGTAYGFAKRIRFSKDNHLFLLGFASSGVRYTINLLKTDLEGNLIKRVTPKFGSSETVNDMDVTTDGGIIVCGQLEGSYNSSLALFRFDSELNLLWKKDYKLEQYGNFGSVLQTTDQGFIATGVIYTPSPYAPPATFVLIKTNPKGDVK